MIKKGVSFFRKLSAIKIKKVIQKIVTMMVFGILNISEKDDDEATLKRVPQQLTILSTSKELKNDIS